jgi:uncharacterized protein YeaO (DUF488 family)
MAPEVRTKRAYEDPEKGDGHRVLIDHIWPRGYRSELEERGGAGARAPR